MPANSTHLDYDASLPSWLRARDVIAGEDAVKTGGIKYLPRLDSQSDDEYDGYKSRACFFNATSRTADGFLGLLFRRDPEVKLPDRHAGVGGALRVFTDDVDLMAGDTPTNAELENGANWTRVFENKNVRMVAIEHN